MAGQACFRRVPGWLITGLVVAGHRPGPAAVHEDSQHVTRRGDMHELSIALSILELVEEEARNREGRIVAVHLRLGTLSGVVRDALLSSYDMARDGSPQASAELRIKDVPIRVRCPRCEREGPPVSNWELVCPQCGAPTPDVVAGRELEIVALEIEP
jgi:hydrogenase nickel incorporation protein HypA/HybF